MIIRFIDLLSASERKRFLLLADMQRHYAELRQAKRIRDAIVSYNKKTGARGRRLEEKR